MTYEVGWAIANAVDKNPRHYKGSHVHQPPRVTRPALDVQIYPAAHNSPPPRSLVRDPRDPPDPTVDRAELWTKNALWHNPVRPYVSQKELEGKLQRTDQELLQRRRLPLPPGGTRRSMYEDPRETNQQRARLLACPRFLDFEAVASPEMAKDAVQQARDALRKLVAFRRRTRDEEIGRDGDATDGE